MSAIVVPEAIAGLSCIVSMSGGKDSTATALALREAGVPYRMVFADTGWEAPETYEHLDHLRQKLGPIDVVGAEGGMVAKIKARAGFPGRMQRWCTQELKLKPLRAFHVAAEVDGVETCCVVGVRAEESESRAKLAPFEDDEQWGGFMWRPILSWPVADVIAIHHRHGVEVNPLYKRGHNRVGCYPCIMSGKEEVRLVAEYAPERIDLIRALEVEATAERTVRNAEAPERYAHPVASFFQSRFEGGKSLPIDRVVEWSQTHRGADKRQLQLLAPPPSGGCFRWGLCEPPTGEGEDGGDHE